MKDVLFIFVTDGAEYHLGLAVLSSALRARGFTTALCRLHLGEGADTFPARLASSLERHDPRVVAVSVVSCLWPDTSAVLDHLGRLTDRPVLVGGWHPTLAPHEVLAHPRVTAICVGEGEEALVDAVDAVRRGLPLAGIPNIWTGSDGTRRSALRPPVPRLDALPPPHHDLFDVEDLLGRNVIGLIGPEGPPRTMALAAGRGCPHRCTYCGNAAFQDRYGLPARAFLRRRSVETVLDEIAVLVTEHRPAWLEFWDEEFTVNRPWLERFCQEYAARVRLPFAIMARPDNLAEDTVRRLAVAGCGLIHLGVESGDESYRAAHLNRHMTNDAIRRGFAAARDHGIATMSFNMIGLPFETEASMRRTLDLNEELQPDFFALFQYNPYPGTDLFERARAAGLLEPGRAPNLAPADAPAVRGVSPEAYRDCLRRARAIQAACCDARDRRYPGRFGCAAPGGRSS